jgi:4-hydroxybenzoate polyprenyltransferase
MWFYLLPLGGMNVFAAFPFWLGLLYVAFPMGLFIYGWNDLMDTDTDRLNSRKGTYLFGARPTDAELKWLPWAIVIVQIPFFAAFLWLLGVKALVLLGALIAFSWLYNGYPFSFKNRPGLDLLNQTGYLLVFMLSSWLNDAPQAPWATYVFGALFAMHSHLLGAMMDIEPDQAAGRHTTANALGRIRAKWLVSAILCAESLVVITTIHNPLIAMALFAGALWFVFDLLIIWKNRPYSTRYMSAIFLSWNFAAILTAPWIWQTAAFA